MAGRHRSTTQAGARSARKSAVWLLQLVGIALLLPLAVLGLLAYGIYAAVTSRPDASAVAVAFQGAAWVLLCADLARTVLRNRPRTPTQLVSLTGKASTVALITIALLSAIGTWQGWGTGPVRWVLLGTGSLIVVYVLVGQRFLRALVESRAAGRPHPS